MEIIGKIIQVMEVVTGMGPKGSWSKMDFVLETTDKYPKKVCITLWGEEQINKYDLIAGMTVTAFINIESREYNGKWFTDVKAWKIEWKEQKRPDFPKKEEPPVQEQRWPQPKPQQEKWPTDARFDVDVDEIPF
jgi:hypothetical protein